MRIFVYEYVSAGGQDSGPLSASLRREGWAMLDALLQDLGRCPGVQTLTLLDARGLRPSPDWANLSAVRVEPGREQGPFFACASRAEYTLLIAPEFDDLLYDRCLWVEEAGGRLLGPAAETVRLTGDKLALAKHLRRARVATPLTMPAPAVEDAGRWPFSFPVVFKPRFGAGSQVTFLVRQEDQFAATVQQAQREGWQGKMIVQPYVMGYAASVAVLTGPGTILPLPVVSQRLSPDDRFHYLGGRLPLAAPLDERARQLAYQAIETLDGVCGYVGVDLVLGPASDGSEDVVIEINPRLTTSYVGLRRLARFNLMEALLAATTGTTLPDHAWREGPVLFSAEGVIVSEPAA